MLSLSRTVRFCLNGDGSLAADAPRLNTFAAWPPMRGLGRYYELEVHCSGEPDPVTGYFMNITRIDAVVRSEALPLISDAAMAGDDVASLMRTLLETLNPVLDGSVVAVRLRPMPTWTICIEAKDMNHVLISQQYEFAAAHRLHVAALSEQENQDTFGKCNNPAGHGHNYRLEVTVRSGIEDDGHAMSPDALDALVDRHVVMVLDHKNLSCDVQQFAGLNTSVENIARVIWEMLADHVQEIGVELDHVRVWETAKTVATYCGGKA